MEDADWHTSGAAIGEASGYDYSSPFNINITSSYGDDLTAETTGGSVSGIHVYRVDSAPNVTTPPGSYDEISVYHYFGVFTVGTSVIYNVTYNYDGHPAINDESTLKLAKRDDNSDNSWEDASATLDQGANTLTKTGESGTEYILGSTGGNALPVRLTSFTANFENEAVVLLWTMESEVGEVGFIIDRRSSFTDDWQQIASYLTDSTLVCMNTPPGNIQYTFTDNKTESNSTYFYRLSDEDIHGVIRILDIIEISLTEIIEIASRSLPENTELVAAYPNPFNQQTKIIYQLDKDAVVDLFVHNVLGQLVRRLLPSVYHSAGNYNLLWDGLDDTGEMISSGTYIVMFKTGEYNKPKKILLLR